MPVSESTSIKRLSIDLSNYRTTRQKDVSDQSTPSYPLTARRVDIAGARTQPLLLPTPIAQGNSASWSSTVLALGSSPSNLRKYA